MQDPSEVKDKSRTRVDMHGQLSMAVLEFEGGQKYQLHSVATVGRAPDCEVVLNAASVSRHHARVFYEGGHYWLKDLDSANGTKLNGKKIRLQMLSDRDKISFGEAKAVFQTSDQAGGPALLGTDPLEGSDRLYHDGTPTGGLVGKVISEEEYRSRQKETELEHLRRDLAAKEQQLQDLRRQIEELQRANEQLSVEMNRTRDSFGVEEHALSTPVGAGSLEQENERLRKLTRQLERALADSNVRIRNLQERLERN